MGQFLAPSFVTMNRVTCLIPWAHIRTCIGHIKHEGKVDRRFRTTTAEGTRKVDIKMAKNTHWQWAKHALLYSDLLQALKKPA